MSEKECVTVTREGKYRFLVDFGPGIPQTVGDEPAIRALEPKRRKKRAGSRTDKRRPGRPQARWRQARRTTLTLPHAGLRACRDPVGCACHFFLWRPRP